MFYLREGFGFCFILSYSFAHYQRKNQIIGFVLFCIPLREAIKIRLNFWFLVLMLKEKTTEELMWAVIWFFQQQIFFWSSDGKSLFTLVLATTLFISSLWLLVLNQTLFLRFVGGEVVLVLTVIMYFASSHWHKHVFAQRSLEKWLREPKDLSCNFICIHVWDFRCLSYQNKKSLKILNWNLEGKKLICDICKKFWSGQEFQRGRVPLIILTLLF